MRFWQVDHQEESYEQRAPLNYDYSAAKEVLHDEPSLDKPSFEVPVGKLIDLSVSNITSDMSDMAERVHPDLKGIDFSCPVFKNEDEKVISDFKKLSKIE